MARISVTVRHAEIPAGLGELAQEKCERLAKFLRGEPRVEIVLEPKKGRWSGEIILHGSRHHERMVAHDQDAKAQPCIEKLVEKIERQLSKSKERRKDHKGPSFAGRRRAAREPASEEPSYEEIVRRDLDRGGGARGK